MKKNKLFLFFIFIILFILIGFNSQKFLNINNNCCILLTMCVNVKTSYNNKNNSPEIRLSMYKEVIDKWLNNTNLDIKIVESSDYKFEEYASNPRIKIYSFLSTSEYHCKKCEATPYEAESILLAFENLNLKKYDKIIKVTGKYYLENFEKLINKIPSDAEIFFQNTHRYYWSQQNSEIFGCKTKYLEEIMEIILDNTKYNMNFESSLYKIKDDYEIYRFPKIKLEKPVLRSGDNSSISEL